MLLCQFGNRAEVLLGVPLRFFTVIILDGNLGAGELMPQRQELPYLRLAVVLGCDRRTF